MANQLLSDIVGNFNQGQDRARAMQANQLAGQAYGASGGDRQSALSQLAGLNPQLAVGLGNSLASQDQAQAQAQQQQQATQDNKVHKMAVFMKSALDTKNPAQIEGAYQAIRPTMQQYLDAHGGGKVAPNTWTPELEQGLYALIGQTGGLPDATGAVVGNALVDKGTGRVLYQGEQQAPAAIQELQYLQQHPDLASFQRDQQAALHPRVSSGGGGGGSGRAPSGYRFTGDGSLEAIPGGPADETGGQGLNDDAVDNAAWSFIGSGRTPAIGRGKEGVAQRTAIMNKAAKIAKDAGISPAELQTVPGRNKALQSSLGNLQKQSDMMEKAETGFANNAQIARDLSAQVDRTGSPVINKWVIGGKEALGDPTVAQLNVAINALATDYARIMSGATGAGGTPISTAEEARKFIRSELTHKQFGAVLDTIGQDIAGQQQAVHSQRGKILGAMQALHDDSAPGQTQQPAPQQSARPRATNPQTGETVEFDGQQWVPVNG